MFMAATVSIFPCRGATINFWKSSLREIIFGQPIILAGAVGSGGCDLRDNEYTPCGQRTAELIVPVIRLDAAGTADLDQMDRLGLLELISSPVTNRGRSLFDPYQISGNSFCALVDSIWRHKLLTIRET
jgi:hypothetical protein